MRIRYWSTSIQHHWLKNIVTREGNTYVDTSSPLGKAAVAATKTFGPALLDDVIRKYVEDPDSFKSAK